MEIESYSICKPIKGICKQRGLWIKQGSSTFPAIYFQRPKWVTDDKAWNQLVESLTITLPKDFKLE